MHACPEPSGQERRTAGIVADWLEDAGCAVQRGVAGNGVLAHVGPDGPTRLVRAELDAVSTRDGVGHHCGHDGHMAMLCAAMASWAGAPPRAMTALLQPAEETGVGMAACLADRHVRELEVQDAYAVHNIPGQTMGSVVLRPGAMASVGLRVRFTGRSSHAAFPHEGQSPWDTMAKWADLAATTTVADGRATLVHVRLGDEAYGTSPGHGVVAATLRAGSDAGLDALRRRLELHHQDGIEVETQEVDPFPATANHPACLAAVDAAAQAAGFGVARAGDPFPWSEDFGHALARWPGALIGLGSGVSQAPLHDSGYEFPDSLLDSGVRLWHAVAAMEVSP